MTEILKTRPLFCAIIFAVICAVICSFLSISGIVVLLVAVLIFLSFVLFSDFNVKRAAVLGLVLSAVLIFSNLLFYIFSYMPAVPYSSAQVNANCVVIESDENCATVYFTETENGEDMKFKSKLYFTENVELLPSAKLYVTVSFDDYSADRYTSSNVHASAYVSEYEVISDHSNLSLLYNYHRFRNALEDVISFDNPELSAFIKGILLGDTSDISGVFLNMFRTVGLSHILSVSGLHLMFAVLFIDKALILFGFDYKKRAAVAMVSAFAFAFVSGFAVSCVRSFIMLVIYYFGFLIDRQHDSLTALSLSAFIILLFSPYNINNISFILSVLATFGMIVVAPLIEGLIRIEYSSDRLLLYFAGNMIKNSLAVSLGANIACIPVFLLVFKQVSVISPLVNLILTIPLQIIFYLSFALILLFPLSFIKNIFRPVLEFVYAFIVKSVEFCYNLKNTTVNDGNKWFYFAFVVLLVLIIGIGFLKRFSKSVTIYPYLAVYVAVCVTVFFVSVFSSSGNIKLKMIDVGQGNCTVIAKDESAVLIDCGGDYYTELDNELRYSNIKRIELVALSHSDLDHTSFLDNILNTYKVDKIMVPDFADKEKLAEITELAKAQGTEIDYISEDCEINVLGGSCVKAYVERAYHSKLDSNSSALYKFEHGSTSCCFTGDMGINQEYVYLDYGSLLDCDILSVAHHGSARSSYEEILKLYSPDYSVISVAANNEYGLPDERIVNRLSEYSEVLTTAQSSTIIFKINDEGYKLLN